MQGSVAFYTRFWKHEKYNINKGTEQVIQGLELLEKYTGELENGKPHQERIYK